MKTPPQKCAVLQLPRRPFRGGQVDDPVAGVDQAAERHLFEGGRACEYSSSPGHCSSTVPSTGSRLTVSAGHRLGRAGVDRGVALGTCRRPSTSGGVVSTAKVRGGGGRVGVAGSSPSARLRRCGDPSARDGRTAARRRWDPVARVGRSRAGTRSVPGSEEVKAKLAEARRRSCRSGPRRASSRAARCRP